MENQKNKTGTTDRMMHIIPFEQQVELSSDEIALEKLTGFLQSSIATMERIREENGTILRQFDQSIDSYGKRRAK